MLIKEDLNFLGSTHLIIFWNEIREICPLYLDNIRQISGNHREKRWCFDIVEEPDRPDKRLKTLSSRRIVPIHDNLIHLGLIDFIQLLKRENQIVRGCFKNSKKVSLDTTEMFQDSSMKGICQS